MGPLLRFFSKLYFREGGSVNNLEYSSTANIIAIPLSRLRIFAPQIIATVVTTALLLDIGLSVSYPTVLISALTGLNNETNPNEFLRMSAVEASWMGSIGYLGKLVGSLTCGFACEYFGRRNAMILITIPHLVSFYLFYYSTTVWKIFVANTLLGFGAGFIKAPSSIYVGEISKKSIRGILVSMTTIAITTGPTIVYLLSNFTPWRNIALWFGVIQIITMIALCFIPESPHWLISKQRDNAALKSFRWLRGWVPQSLIQSEFDSIKQHKEAYNKCGACKKSTEKCTHVKTQTTKESLKELLRKRTLKPFVVVMITGWLAFFTGTQHLLAYMVQILNTYQSPISPNWATVVVSCSGFAATFVGIASMKFLGKRKLYLIALAGVTLSSLILAIYGFVYLPPNSKSFANKNKPVQSSSSYIPLVVFCTMRFFTTLTLLVPFTMLSEVFSMKSRSMATAVTTASNNIMTFIAVKSFYNLENWFDLPTTIGIYSVIGGVGLIISYLILPETEGVSLEDIEIHFSDNNRKLTDRNIARHSSKSKEIC